MRTRSLAVVARSLLAALAVALPAAAGDPPPGFTSLFNGKDLTGWKVPAGDGGHWKVVDGVIDYDAESEAAGGQEPLDGRRVRRLRPARSSGASRRRRTSTRTSRSSAYDGTHKKGPDGKEIKLAVPDSDSGVFLRGSSKSQVNIWCWPTGSGEVYGYRMDEKMPTAVRAGVTPKANADKDVGQWNAFEITMKGDRLTVVLNGVTVLENAAAAGRPREGAARPPAPRPEEGRRLDRPALPRPVPQHLDQGAEVGEARPRFFASSGDRPPERESHQRSARSAATKPVGRRTRTVEGQLARRRRGPGALDRGG